MLEFAFKPNDRGVLISINLYDYNDTNILSFP